MDWNMVNKRKRGRKMRFGRKIQVSRLLAGKRIETWCLEPWKTNKRFKREGQGREMQWGNVGGMITGFSRSLAAAFRTDECKMSIATGGQLEGCCNHLS